MKVIASIDNAQIRNAVNQLHKLKDSLNPKKELRKVFIRSAKSMVDVIKASTPVGETGALQKSIGIIPYLGSRTGALFVGVRKDKIRRKITAFYGVFLEFGTRFIRKGKYSWFLRSAQAAIPGSISAISTEIKKILSKYA